MKSNRTNGPKMLMCLMLGLSLAGTTWAVEGSAGAVTPGEKAPALQAVTHEAPSMERATALIGLPVKNAAGEDLGRVEEIVLTEDHEKIAYLAIAPSEPLPGGKIVRAPIGKVSLSSLRTHFIYDIPKSQLATEAYAMDKVLPWSQRVSAVLGAPLKDLSQHSAGRIRDLLLDVKNNKIATATVGVGGLLGFGEKLASVDWKFVTLVQVERQGSLAMSAATLRSYAFAPGTYWEQLGFVGGESTQPSAPAADTSGQPKSEELGVPDEPARDMPAEPKRGEPGEPVPLFRL